MGRDRVVGAGCLAGASARAGRGRRVSGRRPEPTATGAGAARAAAEGSARRATTRRTRRRRGRRRRRAGGPRGRKTLRAEILGRAAGRRRRHCGPLLLILGPSGRRAEGGAEGGPEAKGPGAPTATRAAPHAPAPSSSTAAAAAAAAAWCRLGGAPAPTGSADASFGAATDRRRRRLCL